MARFSPTTADSRGGYPFLVAGLELSMIATDANTPTADPTTHRAAEDADRELAAAWDVEVFYDGDCPLCRREIDMLRRWDKADKIRFTDIAAAGFDTTDVGVDMPTLMAEIHGRLPSGELLVGVEVFRHLYTAVGLGWAVAPTRWPGVRQGLDLAYRFFAKYRLRFTGRCNDSGGACQIDPKA